MNNYGTFEICVIIVVNKNYIELKTHFFEGSLSDLAETRMGDTTRWNPSYSRHSFSYQCKPLHRVIIKDAAVQKII